MKKKILLTALSLSLLGFGTLGRTNIFAQTTQNGTDPMAALAQKIASKFNLNIADVQAIFDQDRKDKEAERETQYENQLTQYVKDGKITESQKQLILAKHKELASSRQKEMESMKGKTEEEKKALMETKKTEMETQRKALEEWAKQNGIDTQYLMGLGKRGGPGGMGKPSDGSHTPTPSTTQ